MADLSAQELLRNYQRDGFVVVPSALPDDLLEQLRAALPALLAEDGPQRFLEEDGVTVRAVYGLHQRADPWRTAAQSSALARIARLLLGEDMYVFQWKINPKAATRGEHWEWHRDFTFWQREDGMPTPAALTAAVFLDDITEENGPLRLIPGSHEVVTPFEVQAQSPGRPTPSRPTPRQDGDWSALVSANLSYAIPDGAARDLARQHGLVSATGPAGTAVFFHSNLVHGSAPNRSDLARTLGLITYNPVRNDPRDWPAPRPGFFINHDATPLPDVSPFDGAL